MGAGGKGGLILPTDYLRVFNVMAIVAALTLLFSEGAWAEAKPIFERQDCWFDVPEDQPAECGYLVVPENRRQPGGAKVRLAIVILKADPDDDVYADPILYITGGPGSDTDIDRRGMANWLRIRRAKWLDGRDLILFDQRGVGLSKPALECPEVNRVGMELLKLTGQSDEQRKIYVQALNECSARLRQEGRDPANYTTRTTVADIAEMRSALGLEEWNLLGGSYGSRVALAVMRYRPEGVRAVILDSVFPPQVKFYQEEPAKIVWSIDKVAKACAADKDCNNRMPDAKRKILDIMDRLQKKPVMLKQMDPITGKMIELPVNGAVWLRFMVELMAERDAELQLVRYIALLDRGNYNFLSDYVRLSTLAYTRDRSTKYGMHYSVNCNDEYPFTDWQAVQTALASNPAIAEYAAALDTLEACPAWMSPEAERLEKTPVQSNIPSLILNGEFDPKTPPEWAESTARNLPRSFYFEVKRVGHGAIFESACVVRMVKEFLDDPQTRPADACVAQED
jgi:pimeloyl-ACP methyl ester carboxylesterase